VSHHSSPCVRSTPTRHPPNKPPPNTLPFTIYYSPFTISLPLPTSHHHPVPKGRNTIAWGNAPGTPFHNIKALKGRNLTPFTPPRAPSLSVHSPPEGRHSCPQHPHTAKPTHPLSPQNTPSPPPHHLQPTTAPNPNGIASSTPPPSHSTNPQPTPNRTSEVGASTL
jgi:hypothetical protein